MKKILFSILTYLPMILLLAGCNEMDSAFNNPSKEVTLTAFMPGAENTTRVGLTQSSGALDLIASWQEGDELSVFLVQDNEKYTVGKVPVTGISSDGKRANFSFTMPQGINPGKKYNLYAFCGVNGSVEKGRGGSWDVACNTELTRTKLSSFKAPLYGEAELNSQSAGTIRFQHINTYELLHVKNTSNSQISFRHIGFSTDMPWYCAQAGVSFFSGGDMVSLPNQWEGDCESEKVNILAGNSVSIISCYLPSGYQMQNAYLKAEINGKTVVSSNKKSSDVTIERAHAYHQYVTWNGSQLTFDNGDLTTEKIIDVSPTQLDFGTLTYGSSASKTFVVSNVGTADLKFRVGNPQEGFQITDSGKEVSLPVGRQKTFTVTFRPTKENGDYAQSIPITSDAVNGTQYLMLTGKSKKTTTKTISVSPLQIDFGTLAVDEGKEETFVVSNTGSDKITFKVEYTYGDFSISNSGQSISLNAGQSRTFSVLFKPGMEDTSYEQTVSITSDASNGTQYLKLTGKSEKKRITHVIPDEIRDQMDPYIHIYDGINPPNIEGDYVISPAMLFYDSKTGIGLSYGYSFNDAYIRFKNQNMVENTLDFEMKETISVSVGNGAFISGEGDKFSVFFNTESEANYSDYTVYTKEALVISGIKTANGIKNLEYAFVIVEKSSDPQSHVMDVGAFRVIIDGDYLASNRPWSWAPRRSGATGQQCDHLQMIKEIPRR